MIIFYQPFRVFHPGPLKITKMSGVEVPETGVPNIKEVRIFVTAAPGFTADVKDFELIVCTHLCKCHYYFEYIYSTIFLLIKWFNNLTVFSLLYYHMIVLKLKYVYKGCMSVIKSNIAAIAIYYTKLWCMVTPKFYDPNTCFCV